MLQLSALDGRFKPGVNCAPTPTVTEVNTLHCPAVLASTQRAGNGLMEDSVKHSAPPFQQPETVLSEHGLHRMQEPDVTERTACLPHFSQPSQEAGTITRESARHSSSRRSVGKYIYCLHCQLCADVGVGRFADSSKNHRAIGCASTAPHRSNNLDGDYT
jgi:hypothetical protein